MRIASRIREWAFSKGRGKEGSHFRVLGITYTFNDQRSFGWSVNESICFFGLISIHHVNTFNGQFDAITGTAGYTLQLCKVSFRSPIVWEKTDNYI